MSTKQEIGVTSKSFPLVVVKKSVECVLTAVMLATGPVILQMIFIYLVDAPKCAGKVAPMTISAKNVVIIRMAVSVHVLW